MPDRSSKATGQITPEDRLARMGEDLGTNHKPSCRAVAVGVAALVVAAEFERGHTAIDSMAYTARLMDRGYLLGMATKLLEDELVACTCDNRLTADDVAAALGVVGPALKNG